MISNKWSYAMLLGMALVSGCGKSPLVISAKPDTPHQIGAYAESTKSLVATQGQKGALAFGPYIKLDEGTYLATFDITSAVSDPNSQVGEVDVYGFIPNGRENVLSKTPIRASGSQKLLVAFRVAGNADIKYEFRVWSNGAGSMEYRGVEIQKISM
jgi:hypothetical protein